MTTKSTRPKPVLSEAMQKRSDELLETMQSPLRETPSDTPIITGNLRVMRGRGEDVIIAGTSYNLAPYTLSREEEGYALIRSCHALLVAEALAGKEDDITIGDVTNAYNRLVGRTDTSNRRLEGAELPFTPDQVHGFYSQLPAAIDADMMHALYQPILLSLRRHHPSVTEADLEDDFDIGTFVHCLRIIFRQNTGLVDSF